MSDTPSPSPGVERFSAWRAAGLDAARCPVRNILSLRKRLWTATPVPRRANMGRRRKTTDHSDR